MALTQADAQRQINDAAVVTRQHVQIAKQAIASLDYWRADSSRFIGKVLELNGLADERPTIILHERYDATEDLKKAAQTIAWTRAAIQAIWELIHSGRLISAGDVRVRSFDITFTTVYGNSGGSTGPYTFSNMEVPVPATLYAAPAAERGAAGALRDPDLFMAQLAAPNMSSEVKAALSEAVRCFRADLFTAAVAMLGKASEGAWIELGAALLDAADPATRASLKKHEDALDNPRVGPLGKMEAVQQIYGHASFDSLVKTSGIKREFLNGARLWSDVVRDSRNTLHPGVTASTPNTYEKVADLLLSAAQHLPTLYALKAAA